MSIQAQTGALLRGLQNPFQGLDNGDEDSWLGSIGQRAGAVVGAVLGGSFGACYGLGGRFATNYNLNTKNAKAAEGNGDIAGICLTNLIGVVAGTHLDGALNSESPIVWTLLASVLTYYIMGSYARSTVKALAGIASRIRGFVLGSLVGSYSEAIRLGSGGAESGGKIGRFIASFPSNVGEKVADKILGNEGKNDIDCYLSEDFITPAIRPLLQGVSSLGALGTGALVTDYFTGIGFSGALLTSSGMEVLQRSEKFIMGGGYPTIEAVTGIASYLFAAGIYVTGTLEGGLTGFCVRKGVGSLNMGGSLALEHSTPVIKQAAILALQYLYAIGEGYIGLVQEKPWTLIVLTSVVLGAVMASFYSEKEMASSPAVPQAVPVAAQAAATTS